MNSPKTTTTLGETPAPLAGGEAVPRRSTPEYADAWARCRRLGKELSQALADTGDLEYGLIFPAGHECAVSFGMIEGENPRPAEYPMQTIYRLAGRIALLLMADPKMQVERVMVDRRGVHTHLQMPGETGYAAPVLAASGVSTGDLCKLFRLIDILEETASVFHLHLQAGGKSGDPAVEYMVDLQEYLSNERSSIIDELRQRPNADDGDGKMRLSVLMQYDAWCLEFERATVDQFVNSALAREAV